MSQASASSPDLRPRRWPYAVAGGAIVVGTVVAVVALWPASPKRLVPKERASYTRPLPPPHADAFRVGGVPLRDPAVERALIELVDAVARHRASTTGASPLTGEGAKAWQRVVAAFVAWEQRDTIAEPPLDPMADEEASDPASITDDGSGSGSTTDDGRTPNAGSGSTTDDGRAPKAGSGSTTDDATPKAGSGSSEDESSSSGSGSSADESSSSGSGSAAPIVEAPPPEERELVAAVRALDEEFAKSGLGYFVEPRVLHRREGTLAYLHAYRVEDVTVLHAEGRAYPVPSLRRIDHLPSGHSAMGLEVPELGAIVLLDGIARYTATDVLPVLGPNTPFQLGTPGWQRTDPGTKLGLLVGKAVRRELVSALGRDGAAATSIGNVLEQRAKRVAGWRVTIKSTGLFLPPSELVRADGRVPVAELAAVRGLEDELERLAAPRLASVCEQLVAASVRRHELRHQLDNQRPAPLPYPGLLEDLAGPLPVDDPRALRRVMFARAELSGYLSQIIDDPVTPHLTLWGSVWAAFGASDTSAEARAAIVILQGLAKQLGADPEQHPDEPPRLYFMRLAEPLAAVDGARIRTLAMALWTELYGEPHVAITDR